MKTTNSTLMTPLKAANVVLCAQLLFGVAGRPLDAREVGSWTQFMGGAGVNLQIESTGLATDLGPPTVSTVWSRPLGPGYTQMAVTQDAVFVGYSDGERDQLASLSLESGETRWTYDMGPTWRGVDGSDDGPISSPAVGHGLVFGLGPRGNLFALRPDDGEVVWSTDLVADFGAMPFNYGVSTSPLLLDDLLIVQNGGGDGRSVLAFEARTGKLAWSAGDDRVAYQSPLLDQLMGRRQLLAVTGTRVQSLEPTEGTVLWSATYRDEPENHSNTAVVTGSDSFLVTNQVDAVGFRLSSQGGATKADEVWRTTELKRSYGIPVVREGVLYGWSGDFFVALDPETGKRLWKARGVGPASAVYLDDWMALWTVDGRLLFADPDRESFNLVSENPILDMGSLVNPAWTGDGLLLRGADTLVRVRLESGGRQTTRKDPTLEPTGRLAEFLAQLEGRSDADRAARVEAFVASHSFPLVDDDGTVTFVYRSGAADVALVPGGIPVESALTMARAPGTDLWFRTEQFDRRGAYVYHFEVDGQRPNLDPNNTLRSRTMMPSSLLLMPDYRRPPGLSPDGPQPAARGTLEDHRFESSVMGDERNVTVYLPAGYSSEEDHPLVVVVSGHDRIFGELPKIFDVVMGRTVRPAVVAFVDNAEPVEMNVFYETIASRGPLFTRMLVEELLPWLESNYGVSNAVRDRVITGTTLHASRALATALRHPDVFGAVAAQSPNLNAAFERELERLLTAGRDLPRIYVDWCERDSVAQLEATFVKEPVARLLPKLREAGADLFAHELPGGYGWEMFTTQTQRILERFLPLESTR